MTDCGSPQIYIEKQKGEILGVVIVESGWGSILPTVIIANMMHAGPSEKSGRLNIGDQIMSINGTSLVGLPLSTCQTIIKVPIYPSPPPSMSLSLFLSPSINRTSLVGLHLSTCQTIIKVSIYSSLYLSLLHLALLPLSPSLSLFFSNTLFLW